MSSGGSKHESDRSSNEDVVEQLGLAIDRLDNFHAALGLPMPDHLHVRALREGLPGVADDLRRALEAVQNKLAGFTPSAEAEAFAGDLAEIAREKLRAQERAMKSAREALKEMFENDGAEHYENCSSRVTDATGEDSLDCDCVVSRLRTALAMLEAS